MIAVQSTEWENATTDDSLIDGALIEGDLGIARRIRCNYQRWAAYLERLVGIVRSNTALEARPPRPKARGLARSRLAVPKDRLL
jgi:hypothetical protein